ncbi:MAG: hypothetical protein ACLR7Z_00855 [Bilophila wadsworthia]
MALKRKDEATFFSKAGCGPVELEPGYGGALVAHAVEEVRRSGGGTICIGAMYENRKLVRWYERQGLHYGNPKFAHLPFVVFHGEEREGGASGQGGARVGCGVRKIDQAFNLDD